MAESYLNQGLEVASTPSPRMGFVTVHMAPMGWPERFFAEVAHAVRCILANNLPHIEFQAVQRHQKSNFRLDQ
jgi:hypothetical protein